MLDQPRIRHAAYHAIINLLGQPPLDWCKILAGTDRFNRRVEFDFATAVALRGPRSPAPGRSTVPDASKSCRCESPFRRNLFGRFIFSQQLPRREAPSHPPPFLRGRARRHGAAAHECGSLSPRLCNSIFAPWRQLNRRIFPADLFQITVVKESLNQRFQVALAQTLQLARNRAIGQRAAHPWRAEPFKMSAKFPFSQFPLKRFCRFQHRQRNLLRFRRRRAHICLLLTQLFAAEYRYHSTTAHPPPRDRQSNRGSRSFGRRLFPCTPRFFPAILRLCSWPLS